MNHYDIVISLDVRTREPRKRAVHADVRYILYYYYYSDGTHLDTAGILRYPCMLHKIERFRAVLNASGGY